MKKISLTKTIILGLILGMIAGVAINNMATAETAKSCVVDIFIFTTIPLRMVKMIIAPLVILTLVVSIAKMGDAKTLERIFSKIFFLFICAFLASIVLGLVIVNIFQLGAGINFMSHDVGAIAAIKSEPLMLRVSISRAIPVSIAGAMARNEILQIVMFSISLGCSLAAIGEGADSIVKVLDSLMYVMLKLTGYAMLFTPLTVFTAISGLIAEHGLGVMISVGISAGEFRLTLGILRAILIGLFTIIVGSCITRLAKLILEPVLLTLTTSGSEAAFPGTLDKLEKFGVSPKIADFALPIDYPFNLVGSMTYCSFTIVFIAQACNIELSIDERITMLSILTPTSKGMTGAPCALMVATTATLNQPNIPEAGLILLMSVDLFLNTGRFAASVMNNATGTVIVNRREGEHFGRGYRSSVPVKSPEQGRPVTETEVALS